MTHARHTWDLQQRRRAIAASLRVVGLGLQAQHPRGPLSPVVRAERIANGFGFIAGVIADWGISAERAWAVPVELERRLGTLEPAHLAQHADALVAACRLRPMLHRFPSRLARFVHDAARRVVDRYGGDAQRLWGDRPSAAELQVRLRAFEGIGQKKAAMAVDLLMRELGVAIEAPAGNDVAYDVHVRRVFLRTSLVADDAPAVVLAAGRELAADHPAALDYPAWHLGRTYCRPRLPVCELCPLAFACAYAEAQARERAAQLVLFGT